MKRSRRQTEDKKIDTSEADSLSHNPFGALKAIRETLPDKPSDSAQPPAETRASKKPVDKMWSALQIATVRYETKGRGGKAVTLIEKLHGDYRKSEEWLAELKRALGCGGIREDQTLVLQGDQRERIQELISKIKH